MSIQRSAEREPSAGMMAILQLLDNSNECVVDQTPQYFFLLLSKVALNTLVLSFWLRSITKSLLGICSISMYVVDLLLVASVSWAWWFQQDLGSHTSMCFTLSHGSTIYSLLPFPVLTAGAIDYATLRHQEGDQSPMSRSAIRCGAVLLLWALACSYSYCYTDTELLTVDYKEGMKALVCPVQASTALSLFSLSLSIAVGFILLLYYRGLPRWVGQASRLSRQKEGTLAPSGELEPLGADQDEEALVVERKGRPPLFVSLTLCFALNWSPYLFMSMACDALGFPVPAYATINLLWTACANSLLVGVVFWYNGAKNRPPHMSPDDICEWIVYWRLSKDDEQLTASETPHDKSIAPDQDNRHSNSKDDGQVSNVEL